MSSPAERYAASRRRQAASSSELARFAQGYDFPLDPFQEEACGAVERGEGVLVAAPTGAGKTVVGEFAVHLGLARGLKTFYTTPIKALSNQKYLDLVARHGQERVGLLTGDTSVNPHADVVVMTTEVLRTNAEEFGDWLGQVRGRTAVVVSEERPVPLTQHMMVGRRLLPLYSHPAEVPEQSDQLDQSEQTEPERQAEQTGQPPLNPELLKAVKQARRAAASGGASKNSYRGGGGGSARGTQPWKRSARGGRAPRRGEGGARTARLKPPSRLQVVTALEGARLLPAIVFVFSRAGCEQAVHQVVSAGVDLTTEAEAARIREVIERRTADIPVGDLGVLGFHFWAHALERGVAAHHAGLLPVFKETVEELFSAGLVKVVYATETLALGINMPARTVVLESLRKWNGSAHVTLSPGEYTQLTGRAGRRGIDVEGHAVVLAADDVEPAPVSSLASRRTYPLVSAFRPTYNMAVNLLERMPRMRVREVLEQSFAQFQADRGVVELAAQARRKRRSLEGLEKDMTCRLGDFREYASLRQAIADAEADLSRDKSAARRSETGRTMSSLGRGDVIVFRKGRRRRHGIVLEVGTDRTGTPTITVLGEDARVVALTPDTAPDGVMRVGALRVADSVDPHRPRDRDRLVQRLVDALRAGDLEGSGKRTRTRSSRAQARRDSAIENLERLRHEMRSHPCHGCPDREEHARVGRKWSKARAEAERLQRRIENRTGTIARLFDAVCEVLLELGYLHPVDRGHPERELRVTGAGKVLARIYAERDLLIAECLRTGVFEDLSAAELAGALSACVYEPRLSAQSIGLPVAPGSRLGQCLRAQLGVSHRIHDLESLARIEASSGAEPALAGAVQAWCDGAQLADILDATELTAGDFVRWCKQLLDVVGQIASLSPPPDATPEQARAVTDLSMRAAEASLDLNRGVVSWSAV